MDGVEQGMAWGFRYLTLTSCHDKIKALSFLKVHLITGCVCARVCARTYTCVCDPPAEVFSGVVAVEEDGDDVAVGLNLSWRPITAERTELAAARLNLTHTHTPDRSPVHTEAHTPGRGPHLDVVVGASDVGVVLHVEAGVELEAEPETRLHLDPVHAL